ncbi:MAG: hypothetical protein BWY56_02239 [Acidobacteria bacterium ADurb.Bin340]|nr:MAG: hypothetical protein BWY56_02239 [Acidobacteria bacterium ADurb.Bin340]
MLSSRAPSTPGRPRQVFNWSRVSHSTSIFTSRGAVALAAATAGAMPPAAARWFSLSSTPSPRASRWFTPPPQRTAYFSRSFSPGVVLRVSRIRAPVPATASTKAFVRVAVPESRWSRFSITLSPSRMAREEPESSKATWPFDNDWPSSAAASSRSSGSTRRNTSRATGRPATTRSALATTRACMGRSGTAAVVQSWVLQSSLRKASRAAR